MLTKVILLSQCALTSFWIKSSQTAMEAQLNTKEESPAVRLGILETTIGFLLRRAYRRSRGLVMPELEKFGFKEVEISALVIIIENPNCSLSDIAAAVAVDLPVAHRYVERLQKMGCVTMAKSKRDRRVATYKAAPKGARILSEMGELVHKSDNILYEQMSPEEKEALIRSLKSIIGM